MQCLADDLYERNLAQWKASGRTGPMPTRNEGNSDNRVPDVAEIPGVRVV